MLLFGGCRHSIRAVCLHYQPSRMRAILFRPMIYRYRSIQPSTGFVWKTIAAGQEKGALSVSGLGGAVAL